MTERNDEIKELRKQAEEFLSSGYFYAAKDVFERLLDLDGEDKRAHLGVLMSERKINDEEELIRYYQDLYSEDEYEIKLASEKQDDHVKEMCERFFVADYLSKNEIRSIYDFDLSYRSSLFCREKQKKEILKKIDEDKQLSWLKKKGCEEIDQILSAYDRRIQEAKDEDQKKSESIRSEYQRFLYKNYGLVRDLFEKANKDKEDDYRKLIDTYVNAKQVDELRTIRLSFEKFSGYKDADKYIALCEEKSEEIKKEASQKAFQKLIANSMDAAKAALITGNYEEAYDGFLSLIAKDPKNEEAYLGVLMAKNHRVDRKELFDCYKNLYDEEIREKLEACEEDRNHIDEMAKRYSLEGYLSEEEIKEKYRYDLSYSSVLNCRKQQKIQISDEIDTDPIFAWLKANGSKEVRDSIDGIYEAYDLREKQARLEDERKIEEIRVDYQRFLFKTYASIRKLHKTALDKKERRYDELVRRFSSSTRKEEYERLINEFEELADYKDSHSYILSCKEKIQEIAKRNEQDLKDQEVETALIAAKSYLASGNFDLADQTFAKVLSLDPDNSKAYLGILMIETGARDKEELVRYFEDLYVSDEQVSLEACKEDKGHVQEIIDRYVIPGYLEADEIASYYSFDRNFYSVYDSRMKAKELFDEELKMNPLLARAAEGNDAEVTKLIERISDFYQKRVSDAKALDDKQRESVSHIYQVYLEESDQTICWLHEERLQKKNEEDESLYLNNVSRFEEDLDEEGLHKLIDSFDPEYKDGSLYIQRCRQKIQDLKADRLKKKLDGLYENAVSSLKKKDYLQVQSDIEEYLKDGKESEDTHLLLALAHNRVQDEDGLFAYLEDLFSEEEPKILQAVSIDEEHVEEFAERYQIPGLLSKEDIIDKYKFDPNYESLSECRSKQRERIEDVVFSDADLAWLYDNGSDRIKDRFDDLFALYDQRLEDALKKEEEFVSERQREYRAFLRNTDKLVKNLYSDTQKEQSRRRKEEERLAKELARKEKAQEQLKRLDEQRLKAQEEAKVRQEAERQRQALEEEKRVREEEQKKLNEFKRSLAIEEEISKKEEEKALKEKMRLEKLSEKQQEKERRKEERRLKAAEKAANKEETAFKPNVMKGNFTLLLAFVSLLVLGAVTYFYVLEPNSRYKKAVALSEAGEYDAAIAMYEELGDYKDSAYLVKETTYKKADALYESGDIIAAAGIFNNLRFNDSEDRLKAIKKDIIASAKIGDTIFFGDYEQDGNTDNGKEMIEWIVLDKQEGSILVIAKYGLDGQKYNADSERTTWETSTIRSWLNGRFPDNSFSREEPSDVLMTSLLNYRISEEDAELPFDEIIPEEYETRDRIFLLDRTELEQYFPQEEGRICTATEHAIINGVGANAQSECNWWLREQDLEKMSASYIVRSSDGSVDSSMNEIFNAIRPAMWLKAE